MFDVNTYNPYEKTALSRNKLSKPMRALFEKGLLEGKILDYACGNHSDCNFLKIKGLNIVGFDKYNPNPAYSNIDLLKNTYDTITNIYMFNVIPEFDEHQKQLKVLKGLSKNIFIAVRCDLKSINKKWTYRNDYDGWITGNNSFQRFYDEQLITKYFGSVDYILNDSSTKLFKLKESHYEAKSE